MTDLTGMGAVPPGASGSRISPESRHGETAAERNDRNLGDLLQELRVAGLGVQVLFGFLLSLPFTVRFVKLDGTQCDLYEAALLLAASSIALLIAPVAYHRWVFRKHEKERLLRTANVLALAGLATVAPAVCMSVLLEGAGDQSHRSDPSGHPGAGCGLRSGPLHRFVRLRPGICVIGLHRALARNG